MIKFEIEYYNNIKKQTKILQEISDSLKKITKKKPTMKQEEIDRLVENVKSNVYIKLDLEEMIREEMIEQGLNPQTVPDEGVLFEAFKEIFQYQVDSLKYHYL